MVKPVLNEKLRYSSVPIGMLHRGPRSWSLETDVRSWSWRQLLFNTRNKLWSCLLIYFQCPGNDELL